MQSGLSGMMGSLDTQKVAAETLMNVTTQNHTEQLSKNVSDDGMKTRELARAVTGIGNKLDVEV
ncbi:MAG: hypothetical protein AB7E47_01020 [Desulfovibrionaceae bacterium]